MRGHGVLFIIVVCFFISITARVNAQDIVWEKVSDGFMDSDLVAVESSPENPETVFVGSSNVVYKTSDGGEKWNEVLSFRGTDNAINSISISPENPETVYAGTAKGLYRSNDTGLNWERVFQGVGELENAVFTIAVNPGNSRNVYIGTMAGIFVTVDNCINWTKGHNLPSRIIVTSIAVDIYGPHIIYAAADSGIYKSLNSGAGWKRVYESGMPEEDLRQLIEDEETDIGGIKSQAHIREIVVDPVDSQTIYAGTSKGLLVTADGGLTWRMTGSLGLVSRDIRHIVIEPEGTDSVYAATGRGVFRYSGISGSWEKTYKGLASDDIRYLAFVPSTGGSSAVLWAATKRGMFKRISVKEHADLKNSEMETEEIHSMFINEPSIEEILEAAIKYAEVSPEKISSWRKAAASKAWLPDLRFAYDNDSDWQSSRYYYSGKFADDDITEGKDSGWSISLTWELGDLIWSSAQTSIDSRSKLMVELRDDILNEVTRLYFERRRLQYEMVMAPPQAVQEKIEKELRLQELTANIDALTGSYLSKRLKQGSGVGVQKKS